MATAVCTQRRNGEVWMMTLCFLIRIGFDLFNTSPPEDRVGVGIELDPLSSLQEAWEVSRPGASSRACNKFAMRAPSARPWAQPPYVKGGS
jgi:hypothetical protein